MQDQPSPAVDLKTFVKNYRYRHHAEPSCLYLATNRNKYPDIPFGQLITVPFYTTVADLQRLAPGDVKHLAALTSARHEKDLVTTLAKYCKGLNTSQQAAALFEGAIHLVQSTSIPTHSSSKATDGNPRLNSSVDEGEPTAIMADMGEVESIVGPFLRTGLKTSLLRKTERGTSLTEAVRLRMAPGEGRDFRLEVYIGFCAGHTVSQLISTGDCLRDILGDYLYTATESSETKPAVRLTWIDTDCKLELMLGFKEGHEIFNTVFPYTVFP